MQKYWKTVTLIAFLIVGLTLFYIKAGSYTDHLPQYVFHTLEGDEEAMEPFVIRGAANYTMLDTEFFEIGVNGTKYLRDEPFFNRMEDYDMYGYEADKERREEYRSFMRGKWGTENYFDESDDMLAYASVDSDLFSFEQNKINIDVLQKQTDERTTFSIPISDYESYWYMDVLGIKVIDDRMYVFVEASKESEDVESEENTVRQYTIDLDTEQITGEKDVASVKSKNDENGHETLRILFNEGADDLSYLVVHDHISYEMDEFEDLETAQSSIKSMELHHIEDGEKQDVSIKELKGYPVAWMDGHVYLAEFKKDQLEMMDYEIESGKVTATAEIGMASEMPLDSDELEYHGIFQNGKWYVTTFQDGMTAAHVAVVDLENLSADYIGEMEMKLPDGDERREQLYRENSFLDSVDMKRSK